MTLRARCSVPMLLVALVASLLVSLSAQPASAASACQRSSGGVSTGAHYSMPGSGSMGYRLVDYIRHVPAGGVIRSAQWAFTSGPIANALIDAYRCGVHVKMVVPNKAGWREQTALMDLIRAIGRGDSGRSFVKVTNHAARGPNRFDGGLTTMHMKTWQFSTAGSSKRVSMIASANATSNAFEVQAMDYYMWASRGAGSTGDKIYVKMAKKFDQLVNDHALPSPYADIKLGKVHLYYSPWNSPGMADPVVQRIRDIPLSNMTIRIGMASWSGKRGERIANALRAKVRSAQRAGYRAGLFVLLGAPSWTSVKNTLSSVGQVCNGHPRDDLYIHSKFMTALYHQGGKTRRVTWAGSENWGDGPRGADELGFRVTDKASYDHYREYFDAATDRLDPSCSYR